MKRLIHAAIGTALCAAMVPILLQPAQAQSTQAQPARGFVQGAGYADFDSGGSPGNNLYWVFANGGPGRSDSGQWYADVFIDFGGFQFDFEALYSVDCLLVDHATGEAWIEGRVIKSNDPASLGLRAFLYILDGGPGGQDFHAITPLDDPALTCDQRPHPDFMEAVQVGDYRIR